MLWRRLAYLLPWRRRAAERDMQQELQSLAEMAQPGELGNLALAAEDARAELGWTRLEQGLQDLFYALRTLRRTPGFSCTAILSLALGIGATAAIFSVLVAVLLRPLPFDDSDRMVRILEHRPADAGRELGYPQQVASVGVSDLPALRSQATTLSHIGGYAGTTMTLTTGDGPIRVPVTRVSPSVLAMLGFAPRLGRLFEPREETAGLDSSVILSHTAWQRYFGSAPDVVSKGISIDGRNLAVVGVMPEGFRFPDPQTEFWIPYPLSPPRGRVAPVARLADGVSLEAATAQVSGILSRLQPTQPGRKPSSFEVQTMRALLTAPVKRPVHCVWCRGCRRIANRVHQRRKPPARTRGSASS